MLDIRFARHYTVAKIRIRRKGAPGMVQQQHQSVKLDQQQAGRFGYAYSYFYFYFTGKSD